MGRQRERGEWYVQRWDSRVGPYWAAVQHCIGVMGNVSARWMAQAIVDEGNRRREARKAKRRKP